MDHPFQKEVAIAQALARHAGVVAKSLKAGSQYSQKLNNEGPVSDADLEADRIILLGLKSEFPTDLLISEETALPETFLPATGRVWLVDPIDGTADFVAGGLDYSVMIGLLVDGVPAVGIVYGPETDEMWTGVVWSENGVEMCLATRQHQDAEPVVLNIKTADAIFESPVVAISKNHPSQIADRIAQILGPSQIIKKGSLGLKVALISDGKADFYVAASRRIKVWDTCAPFALIKAAGGSAYTFSGVSLTFGPTCTHNTPFFVVSHRYATTALKKLLEFNGR